MVVEGIRRRFGADVVHGASTDSIARDCRLAGVIALGVSGKHLGSRRLKDIEPDARREAPRIARFYFLFLIRLRVEFMDGHTGQLGKRPGQRFVRDDVMFIFHA